MTDRISIKQIAEVLLIDPKEVEGAVNAEDFADDNHIFFRKAHEVVCRFCEAGQMRHRICERLGIY